MNLQVYRPFQQVTTDFVMVVRMWVRIFKINCGIWLAVLLVLVLILTFSPMTAAIFFKVLPFTALVFGLYPLLVRRAYRLSNEQKIALRGPELVPESELAQRLKSDPEFSKEPLLYLTPNIAIAEIKTTEHVIVVGSSGSGKTNFFRKIIAQLRKLGRKLLILDAKDGELLSQFFNPETDHLFNVFDERSLRWNLFDTIGSVSDYITLAATAIPEVKGTTPFWTQSAREVLAACLEYVYRTSRSMQELYRVLCLPTAELYQLLLQLPSPAAQYIQNPEGGQAQGVISTLRASTNLIFRFLATDEPATFSMRDWLQSPGGSALFLVNNVKHQASLKGQLSLFLTGLTSELLSRPDSQDLGDMVHILLDECATLHKSDSLIALKTLSRSKMTAVWIGIQEKAPLDDVYGKLSTTLINNSGIFLVGKLADPPSGEYFSKILGQQEISSLESSYSTQVQHQHKDSGSIRADRRFSPLVLQSELAQLEALNFYIKCSSFPITKAVIPYETFPSLQPRYIENRRFSSDYVAPPVPGEEPVNGQTAAESGQRPQDSLGDDLRF